MKICLLGYSGNIGSKLLIKLNNSKNNLILISRIKKHKSDKLNYIFCDLNEKSNELTKAFSDCDVIINMIGEYKDESKMMQTNFKLVQNLFEHINVGKRKKKIHFVQISSCSVYGYNNQKRYLSENSKTIPTNYYGKTKLYAENLIKKNKNKLFTFSIIRPSGVIDNTNNNSLLKFLDIATKKIVILFGKKDSIGNFVHIDDLIELIHEVTFNKKAQNKIYNISNNFTYDDLLRYIDEKLSISPVRIYFYSDLFLKIYLSLRKLISNFFYIPDISFLAYKTTYDSNLIVKDLNFKFKKDIKKTLLNNLINKKIANSGKKSNNNI